jgi:hypothetical protein
MPSKLANVVYGTALGELTEVAPSPEPTPVKTPIKGGVGDALPESQIGGVKVGTRPPEINPSETILSSESVRAFHSTLFRRFNLRAISTYNFYVDGEDVAPTFDASGSLSDLPRYVTLRWATAPTLVPKGGNKTSRPFASPKIISPPIAVKFDVAASSLANGFIEPGVISSIITAPIPPAMNQPTTLDEDSFLLDPAAAGQSAADHVGDASSPYTYRTRPTAREATVVKFIDPSIVGALDANRITVAQDPAQLTVLGSLTKIMGSLEVISEFNQDVQVQNPPPDFTGVPDAPAVLYVGYVIERHDLKPDGSMVRGRVINIDDPTQDEFIDRQVAYNGTYFYRIRSIVQWTRTSNVDFMGLSTIDRQTAFSSLVAPPLSSFYAGDWSDWARTQVIDNLPPEPPDEIIARPVSWKGEIHVSWKEPNDPQRDISSLVLVRATSDDGMISDWKEIKIFPVGNGLYVDRDVVPFEQGQRAYIYALYSNSYHGVISPLSEQIEVRLSSRDSREEFPVVQLAPRGADPMIHASARQMVASTEINANRRLTFYCRDARSGHPLRDSTYVIEVRSLATGERALVTMDVDAIDIGVADA